VVHAADDPFIPVEPFYLVRFPANLALELLPSGGHLGYLSRTLWRGDCRWLDMRLTAWLASHWGTDGTRDGSVTVTETASPATGSRRSE
jgi:predicted alpha/beta-fold hydrolase